MLGKFLQHQGKGSGLSRYGVGLTAVAIALAIKLLLSPVIHEDSPFLLFFAAIIVGAFYGGLGVGLTTTLLAAALTDWLFWVPDQAFVNQNLGQNLGLLLFLLEGGFISLAIAHMRSVQRRLSQEQIALQRSEEALQQAYQELDQRVQERTSQLHTSNQELLQEIAERQRMATALQESERRFRAIFNSTFQFIGLMQPDGILLEANQTALSFGGFGRDRVVGQPFWEAPWWTLSSATQDRLKAAIAQAATGQFIRYEVDVRGAGDQIATIDFSIQPIWDEGGQVVLLIPEGRNITEQKQAEQTLQRFFENASTMMGIVELVGQEDIRHLADNSAVIRFFGGDPAQPSPPLASQRGVTADHLQQWIGHYCLAAQTQQPVHFEYWHEADAGKRHCLAATVCTLPSPTEAPRFAYIVEDITERKQNEIYIRRLNADLERRVQDRTAQLAAANAQLNHEIAEREQALRAAQAAHESLRLSNERFRIALQHSPITVFNQDRDLRYTWIYNPKLGHAVEAVLGKTDLELMSAEEAAQLHQLKQQVMALGQGLRQEVKASTMAQSGYFDLNVEPLRNESGQIVGITAAAIDITERKQAEANLQNRARQQAAVAHLGQHALATYDVDELMTEALDLIAATLDVPYVGVFENETSQAGPRLRWHRGWPSSDASILPVKRDLETDSPGPCQPEKLVGVDLLPQDWAGDGLEVAIAGPTQPFGLLGAYAASPRHFSQDDTHFLQAAANILAEALQRQQSRETLQQQSEELAQANRLKDEFLSTLSHELRTPLHAMSGWAKLLSSRRFDTGTTERAIETIARNTQSLTQVIEDVLDMSALITGRLTLQVAPVDLALVIEQAIAALHLAAQSKQIQIEFTADPLPTTVLGDAARLQQIVWNLLSNSIKFTPPGGKITLSLETLGQLALIRITDTGKGISPKFLPFVFDRFRQEDSSAVRTYGGLGLGLSIVRYLVEMHGGSIEVDSSGLGQGSMFQILLPLNKNPH